MFSFWKKKKTETLTDAQKKEIEIGKIMGVHTDVYNKIFLTPQQMALVREKLLEGASESALRFLVGKLEGGSITGDMFDGYCKKSVYIADRVQLLETFVPEGKPTGKRKEYPYPAGFYGSVFGDIAGSAYEFSLIRNTDPPVCYRNCLKRSSACTDDSVLTLATAVALQREFVLDRHVLELADFTEENRYPITDNPFTEAYHEAARKYPYLGYGGAFFQWSQMDIPQPYGSYGNGAAMRVAPIADYCETTEQVIDLCIASAIPTHNHLEGVKGAIVTAMAGWMARNSYSREEIFRYGIRFYPKELMGRYLMSYQVPEEHTLKALRETSGPAVCPYAVPAALICFHEGNSFEETMDNCLSFNGDTDTIAAIAGGIAGNYYGVPEEARRVVCEKLQPYIEAVEGVSDDFLEKGDFYGR